MKSTISALAVAVLFSVQSASACFFPFFPTYSAGYAPWGYGWNAGYTPTYYGGASYRAGYFGSNADCCGTTHSVGYRSYAAPQLFSGSGCCDTGCATGCSSGCGTCVNNVSYGGVINGGIIGNSSCVGCGSDCVGTETRKVPEPDIDYNRDRDREPRDFNAPGTDRDRLDSRDRPDDRDRLDTRDRLDNRDRLDDRDRSDRGDGFSPLDDRNPRDSDLDRNRLDSNSNWRDRDRDETGRGGLGSDSENAPFSDNRSDVDDRSNLDNLTRPRESGNGVDRDGFGNEPFPGFDGSSRKPPMPDTTEPAADDQTSRKPIMPDIDNAKTGEAPTTSIPLPDADTDVPDFLPADDPTEQRSSHVDVLRMTRLAGGSRGHETTTSQVSSSRSKTRPARWISLPMPAGRARL